MKTFSTKSPYHHLILLGLITCFSVISSQAHADSDYRADLTQQIIGAWQNSSDQSSSTRWLSGMQAWLDKLSTDKLEEALHIEEYQELEIFIRSNGQKASNNFLLDTPSATGKVYYSLTPCRIVDTRDGSGAYAGPIGGGSSIDFHAKDTAEITLQGGNAAGCNVPASAVALVMNITSVDQASNGFLTAFPAGEAQPGSSILNFNGINAVANSTILPVCTVACTADFSVFANQSTHVIVDVMGYFAD